MDTLQPDKRFKNLARVISPLIFQKRMDTTCTLFRVVCENEAACIHDEQGPNPLVGFGGQPTDPKGAVVLPLTLGTEPCQVTQEVMFLVVDTPPYNAILGESNTQFSKSGNLNLLFETHVPNTMGDRGSPWKSGPARECYVHALGVMEEAKEVEETYVLENDPRESGMDRPEPVEELIEFPVNDNGGIVKLGADLPRILEDRARPVSQGKSGCICLEAG
ncbi:hypothetical protein CRG98_014830 [Punica granatum]|uniref:Uncharacterized protein n=1 Tax=Punica granatum TaxID=22663 RepID=A0A2I0K8A2_PUNGR|nr:hypothetical protein CRG98_014830 [Punica granatum]